MKVILPSAGKGTRLRPFSLYRPKSLLRIYSKTIIEHLFERMKKWVDFEEIILVISNDEFGYKTYEFLKNLFHNTNYEIQENPLGLADAVYKGLKKVNEDVLIVLPDALYDGKFTFDESFIAVKQVDDPRRFGVVSIKNNYITDLEEKPDNPKTNLAICGIYYIKNSNKLKEAIEILYKKDIKTKGEFQLTDALRILIENYKIKALEINEWQDCGKVETYLETMKYILNKNSSKILSNVKNSEILEPVFINQNCIIENSIIGQFVDISENCKIINSKIKNSIIMENTIIENSVIENSVIGSNVHIKNFNGKIIIGDFGMCFGADRT
ncbi:MAG: sugar phosphate nucleotidyltransferase [Candidatus Hydrothermia bacterium]|nr:sugar phosphate nucleotidyltransferase [Candidatus Hydrothermia bacterium]